MSMYMGPATALSINPMPAINAALPVINPVLKVFNFFRKSPIPITTAVSPIIASGAESAILVGGAASGLGYTALGLYYLIKAMSNEDIANMLKREYPLFPR